MVRSASVYRKPGNIAAAAIVDDAKTVLDRKLKLSGRQNKSRRKGFRRYLDCHFGERSARKKIETMENRGRWVLATSTRWCSHYQFRVSMRRARASEDLAAAGAEAETTAEKVELADTTHSRDTARRRVREALIAAGVIADNTCSLTEPSACFDP